MWSVVAAAGDVDVVVDLATKDEARLTTTTTTTISVGPPPREWIERRAAERISQPAWCEPRPRSRHDLFLSVSVACGRGTSVPLFFFLLSFSFVRERSTERKDLFLAWSLPYLTRLIYASLLLYNSLSTRVSSFNQIGPSAFLGGRFLTTEIECLRCRTFEPYTVYNLQSFVSKNRIRIHTYIFVYLYLRSIACL